MGKRFTPKDIHPSIFEEVHDLTNKYMAGNVLDSTGNEAISKHFGVWVSEYKVGFTLWLLGLIPVIAGAGFVPEGIPKGVKVVVLFGLVALWLFFGYLGYLKNKDLITWEELEALRPGMNLDEHQNLYLDCLRYVEQSNLLDNSQKQSWREGLYKALDQSLTVKKLSEEMKSSSGGKNHADSLEEIAKLEALVAGSSDELAKKAYEESLAMARERMSKWDGIAAQAERTEAHMELTRQTLLKTRDTLKGLSLQQQQTIHVDLEPLRANLGRVQSDAYEIQRAIEELRQI